MNNIKWVFFDVGGVLTDESAFTQWIQEHATEVLKKYDSTITLQKVKEARPIASAMEGNLNENMLKVFLKDAELAEALKEWKIIRKKGPTHVELQKIKPEALETVRTLSEKYNLGLIANQHKEMKKKLTDAGILQYFKHAEVSEDYGVEKPNPKFFEIVMKEVGAEPAQSVIVDDNLERSIIPAKKLGMTTVWMKLEERSAQEGTTDHTVSSLKDLLRVL